MSAAVFVLAINLSIAGIFATAFAVLAMTTRSAGSARWMAAAYGFGVLYAGLEFILPMQDDPRLVGIGIFAAFLFSQAFSVVGLSRHYAVVPPWRVLAVVVCAAMVSIVLIIDMERASLLRATLYQLPYAVMQLVSAAVIMRARRRGALDNLLLALNGLASVQFLIKPVLAALIGSGATPQAYLGSIYAAVSQTTGAVLLIANGLLVLLIMVRSAMAEMIARSETDALSGLLNRRGFEDRAERVLATAKRAGVPVALVMADLDHFKAVNDSFGHEAGDQVIISFAAIVRELADPRMVLGRLGGEEFAVLLPGGNLAAARLFAEGARSSLATDPIGGHTGGQPVTASFGVAQQRQGEPLMDLVRRADRALYAAKSDGRNRVSLAEAEGAPTGQGSGEGWARGR
ncbi:MAG: GGDEF domain-containing protein [Alphaproteobacteria bacterium]|nr:GGDEF domain-containing protein [Alphaproteobacteria bacterium]